MTELENIELQCRRLINAPKYEYNVILRESVGYLGLAKAYVELSNQFLQLKAEREDI